MCATQDYGGFSEWHARVLAGMLLWIAAGDAAWGHCEPVWTQRMDVPGDDEAFRQLWEWDGALSTRRSDVIGGPQGRHFDRVEMVYDSWRGMLVVPDKSGG